MLLDQSFLDMTGCAMFWSIPPQNPILVVATRNVTQQS